MNAIATAVMIAAAVVPSAHTAEAATQQTTQHYSDKQGRVSLATVGDPGKLPGAPRGLRAFLRTELRHNWQSEQDGDPACKNAGKITVREVDSRGYANGTRGTQMPKGCDKSVSGARQLYAVRGGEWKSVFTGEDIPQCARLERLDFPSAVAGELCMDGGQAVPYTHA
jgi:hypothetical protein